MQSSIVVSEFPQRLQVANAGAFLPGSVENVLAHPGRPPYYPNKHLCDVIGLYDDLQRKLYDVSAEKIAV